MHFFTPVWKYIHTHTYTHPYNSPVGWKLPVCISHRHYSNNTIVLYCYTVVAISSNAFTSNSITLRLGNGPTYYIANTMILIIVPLHSTVTQLFCCIPLQCVFDRKQYCHQYVGLELGLPTHLVVDDQYWMRTVSCSSLPSDYNNTSYVYI